ncbi:DUF2975 domain-containing protein [uncultured Serinicoccus sp.]|uniref:DUF2975 domain-containing protein n=1 Tax=uncultured Serinicoccus sp. TaxID=735514 RepID=UPI0026221C34|nr:DUF2975 domain-containing protein [uncultured Serinicoccus sp.]
MDRWVVRVLQGVIAVALLGSLVVQLVVVPLLWLDLEAAPPGIRTSLAVIGVLGVLTLQVVGVCVWRLLTMVSRHTVFSPAAFRWVDVAIGAIGTGALLLLALAVVARNANHAVTGDAVAPGVVGLVCGAALVVGGVALLVYVMRTLLAQAISLGAEARSLQSELDEVI